MTDERELLTEAIGLLNRALHAGAMPTLLVIDIRAAMARYAALPPEFGVPGDVDQCATCGRPTSYVVCPGDGSMIPCCSDACFPGRDKPATPEAPATVSHHPVREALETLLATTGGNLPEWEDAEAKLYSFLGNLHEPGVEPPTFVALRARVEKAEAELVQAFADQRRLSVTAQEAIASTVDKLEKCRAELEAAKGAASRTPEELAERLVAACRAQGGWEIIYRLDDARQSVTASGVEAAQRIIATIFRNDVTSEKEGG